jgi:hypothetical protein
MLIEKGIDVDLQLYQVADQTTQKKETWVRSIKSQVDPCMVFTPVEAVHEADEDVPDFGMSDVGEVRALLLSKVHECIKNNKYVLGKTNEAHLFTKAHEDRIEDVTMEHVEMFTFNLTKDTEAISGIDTYAIHLKEDASLRHCGRRNYKPEVLAFIKKKVQELVDAGLIVMNPNALNTSPLVITAKAGGGYRFTIDYRHINKQLQMTDFPLPDLEGDLARFANGKRYLSVADLTSGYWQVDIDEDTGTLLSFVANGAIYSPTRLPQGCAVSGTWFQSVMHRVLEDMIADNEAFAYQDDIITGGDTIDSAIDAYEKLLKRCKSRNIHLNPKKLQILTQEVNYGGHVLSGQGLKVDPARAAGIDAFKTPENAGELCTFIHMAQYVAPYIEKFKERAAPLYTLLRAAGGDPRAGGRKTKQALGRVRWQLEGDLQWTAEHQDTFKRVKDLIGQAAMRTHPSTDKTFVLVTDASNTHIGGMLGMIPDSDVGKPLADLAIEPVAYTSWRLTDTERKFSTVEVEALSIITNAKRFKTMFHASKPFMLFTDAMALYWILDPSKSKVKVGKQAVARVHRWLMSLQEMHFEVYHVPGVDNDTADAMSRLTDPVVDPNRRPVRFLRAPGHSEALGRDYFEDADHMGVWHNKTASALSPTDVGVTVGGGDLEDNAAVNIQTQRESVSAADGSKIGVLPVDFGSGSGKVLSGTCSPAFTSNRRTEACASDLASLAQDGRELAGTNSERVVRFVRKKIPKTVPEGVGNAKTVRERSYCRTGSKGSGQQDCLRKGSDTGRRAIAENQTKTGLEHQKMDSEGSNQLEHSINTDSAGYAAVIAEHGKKRVRVDQVDQRVYRRKSSRGEDSSVLGVGMYTGNNSRSDVPLETSNQAAARVHFMQVHTETVKGRTERQTDEWLCGNQVPHQALLCALEIDREAEQQAATDFAFKPWRRFEFPSLGQIGRAQERSLKSLLTEDKARYERKSKKPLLADWVGDPVMINGTRYRRARHTRLWMTAADNRIWIPDADSLRMRFAVIAHMGQSGHVGINSMHESLKRKYFWPKMRQTLEELKASCYACQSIGSQRTARPLGDVRHARRPFEGLHADFVSLERVTAEDAAFLGDSFVGKYVLVLRDDFSGYTRLVVCTAADSAHAVEAILDWVSMFSTPEWLCTDQGKHLKEGLMTTLMERLESFHYVTPVYASWSNGFIERAVGIVVQTIKKLLSERQLQISDWKPLIALVQHRLNHTTSRVLGGRTPFEVATGQTSSSTLSLLATATPRERDGRVARTLEDLTAVQKQVLDEYIPSLQQHLFDMHVVVDAVRKKAREVAQQDHQRRKHVGKGDQRRPPDIKVGDYVLHMTFGGKKRNKLLSYWKGPKQVVRKIHDHLFEVLDLLTDETSKVHDSYLRFYLDKRRGDAVDRDVLLSQYRYENSTYVPKDIVGHNIDGAKVTVRVVWEGIDEVTDEPLHRFFEDVPHLVKKYIRSLQDSNQRHLLNQMIA